MTAKPPTPTTPTTPPDDPGLPLPAHTVDGRPYSPGLEGVLAAETELGLVDGANGRLMYRGYRIGDLVTRGTFPAVANLLWTGTWDPRARLTAGRVPSAVMSALRALPRTAKPMDALRTAVSVWGATQVLDWPPTEVQARALTAFSPSALAAFVRLREDLEPIDPDPELDLVSGLPVPADRRTPRQGHGPRPRRLLHRRRRAWPQRIHVHRPGDHLHEVRHGVGGHAARSGP